MASLGVPYFYYAEKEHVAAAAAAAAAEAAAAAAEAFTRLRRSAQVRDAALRSTHHVRKPLLCRAVSKTRRFSVNQGGVGPYMIRMI